MTLALAATSCGEARPLDDVGDFSQNFIHGETTTTLTIIVEETGEEVAIGDASDVVWHSDTFATADLGGDADSVIAAVFSRYDGSESFIQASRGEIAAAVPGIQFPFLLPKEVGFVTSQLVVDPESASVDGATSAAFGLWSLQPYTVSRAEGQVGVLRVGARIDETPEAEIIARSQVDEGISLQWSLQGLRYELFCRTGLVEDSCWQMAENLVPLSSLVP